MDIRVPAPRCWHSCQQMARAARDDAAAGTRQRQQARDNNSNERMEPRARENATPWASGGGVSTPAMYRPPAKPPTTRGGSKRSVQVARATERR